MPSSTKESAKSSRTASPQDEKEADTEIEQEITEGEETKERTAEVYSVDVNSTNDLNVSDGNKKSRNRPRKRKLYVAICKQMEFYFSDANITKNRMMYEIVSASEYVDLKVLMEFNKLRKLTTKIEDVQKALVTSDLLDLSSERLGVRRKIPFDPDKVKDEAAIEECTIYVEDVPKHVDHEWLETIFQVFGPIAYISLPKFRHNGQPKGFAFIEYESPDGASRCLEAYGEQGACLPNDLDPAELLSVQTFQDVESDLSQPASQHTAIDPEEPSSSGSNGTSHSPRKRKVDCDDDEDDSDGAKRKKLNDDEEEECEDRGIEIAVSHNCEEEEKNSKKKRKKNKTKKTTEEKLESDSIKLRVLPKKKWRQLRNRYLNLQRENMSKMKRQIRQQQLRTQHFENQYFPVDPQENGSHEQGNQKQKSVVVKIDLETPSESVDVFMKQIMVDLTEQKDTDDCSLGDGFVKFVDYAEGQVEAYVRLDGAKTYSESVSEFVQKAGRVFKTVTILSDKENDEYWLRVREGLRQKKKQKLPKKHVRGRDRLLKAASKVASHIHFETEKESKVEEGVSSTGVKEEIPVGSSEVKCNDDME